MSFFKRKGKTEADTDVVAVQSSGYEAEGEGGTATPPETVLRHADAHMKRLKDQHRFDPYMEIEKLDAMDSAIASGDAEKEAAIETSLVLEDSPYAEVRAAVSHLDSLDSPILFPRPTSI